MASAPARRMPRTASASRRPAYASRWCSCSPSMNVLLPGAEDLVTGIAQAGDDVALFIEPLVDRSSEYLHVRMQRVHPLDAFGARYQHQGPDLVRAGTLEQLDGGNHGAPGRQHRVDNQSTPLVELADQLLHIGIRFQGLLVAYQSDHADPGAGDETQNTVEHAQASTQDRHDGDFLAGEFLDVDIAAPTLDSMGLNRHVLGGFIGQQGSNFLRQFTEVLGTDIVATHQTEFMADKGVLNFTDLHWWDSRRAKYADSVNQCGRPVIRKAAPNHRIACMAASGAVFCVAFPCPGGFACPLISITSDR